MTPAVRSPNPRVGRADFVGRYKSAQGKATSGPPRRSGRLPERRAQHPARLLVRGRRLGPQVEFGAVRLDLAPHGSQAECQHGQDGQLLHCVLPYRFSPSAPGSSKPSKRAYSSLAVHTPGVPHRLGSLVYLARLAEHEEPVERLGEPAVVRDRKDGSRVAFQTLLQGLRTREVEIVGWLVEQQQRRPGQLKEQDLQPCLLAA